VEQGGDHVARRPVGLTWSGIAECDELGKHRTIRHRPGAGVTESRFLIVDSSEFRLSPEQRCRNFSAIPWRRKVRLPTLI
jgi:hypothetical protein